MEKFCQARGSQLKGHFLHILIPTLGLKSVNITYMEIVFGSLGIAIIAFLDFWGSTVQGVGVRVF